MPELVSLLDAIHEPGFEASLIATFNAYLPFYEQVVLRRLLANGCRHNTLFIDATQLAVCLESATTTPAFAGFDYTIAPMASKSSFHPKLLLLLGPKRAITCIGSHNLTLSGFGLNRELTCKTTWMGAQEDWSAEVARAAWHTARHWLDCCGEVLPHRARKNILAIEDIAPWLRQQPADTPKCRVIFQSPGTSSLWDQLSALVDASAVKRVTVVGAFFDSRCLFIQRLNSVYAKARIQVVIEPETVQLNVSAAHCTRSTWYDGSTLAGHSGYLHAKALFFETNSREGLLYLGSANPSAPAWGISPNDRNEELGIVWSGKVAFDLARELGLADVADLPRIGAQALKRIGALAATRGEEIKPTNRLGGIAIISGDEIEVPIGAVSSAKRSEVVGDLAQVLCDDVQWTKDGELARARLSRADADRARLVRISPRHGPPVMLVCHHAERREAAARTGRQAQLRQALASLEGDPTHLANLLAAVQKVVFDSDVNVRSPAKHVAAARRPGSSDSDITSLEGTAELGGKRSRPRLAHGDLGYLLQVLIYELGKSLPATAGPGGSAGVSEEDRVDSDDETPTEPQSTYEGDQEIAEACGRRVGTLVNRMIRVLEETATSGERALTTVAQLTAVLCTLRALRQLERQERWRRTGLSLAPEEYRQRLLGGILESVIGGPKPLMRRGEVAAAEHSMEVGHLRGLMIWLAWDCKFRADRKFSFADEREDREQNVLERAALLELIVPAVPDSDACAEAERSVEVTASPRQLLAARAWIHTHLAWGRSIRDRAERLGEGAEQASVPARGSIIALPTAAGKSLHVVAGQDGGNVVVVDLTAATQERSFRPDKLIRVAPA